VLEYLRESVMMALAYCSGVTVKVMSVSVQAVQLKQGMN
jgi:hypothetical protein